MPVKAVCGREQIGVIQAPRRPAEKFHNKLTITECESEWIRPAYAGFCKGAVRILRNVMKLPGPVCSVRGYETDGIWFEEEKVTIAKGGPEEIVRGLAGEYGPMNGICRGCDEAAGAGGNVNAVPVRDGIKVVGDG
jgi:hypothetical protein